MTYNTLEFSKYEYDNGLLKLYYNIENFEFIEEINFNPNGKELRKLNTKEQEAHNLSFQYLHLVAGISYYKTLLPKNIKINTYPKNLTNLNY